MRLIRLRITRAVLSALLSRPCERIIPRSGERGAAVNCFVIAIDKNEAPYLLVESLNGEDLVCIKWDGNKYSTQCKLPLANLSPKDFHITHYYGVNEIHYQGILQYIISRATRWPYIGICLVRIIYRFDQYFFNKKKLISDKRIKLLRLLVNETLDGRPEHELLGMMTKLYSIRWFSHPQGQEAKRRLEAYLNWLEETGELRKQNHTYIVTGKALHVIEEYEEQERKHAENIILQRSSLLVALTIALLTFVQAGLVRLPPLIDLSDRKSIELKHK
jgi:hypothetical protein